MLVAISSQKVGSLGGGLPPEDREVILGVSSGYQRMHGSLLWGGPMYSPQSGKFTRLRGNSDGRLYVSENVGGVAYGGYDPYLYIPRGGLWLLGVTQAWESDTGARGAGLGESKTYGDHAMHIWSDIGLGRFITATRLVWLPEGTKLYPWIWATETNSRMSPSDRGILSTYSATYIGG